MTATPPHSLKAQIRPLLTIAAPLIAAYLAEYSMFVTTRLVIGELGYTPLAAVGLAGSLAFEALVVTMGLLSITGVLAAQAEGAGRKAEVGNAARQGLLVALAISLPATALVWNLDIVLRWTGQDAEIVALGRPYLQAFSLSVLPTLLFTVLRNFVSALSRTKPVMAITVVAVFLNWGLAEALVHGRWAFPELGVAGAGVAATVTSWAMVAALTFHIWRAPALRGYGLFRARLRFDPAIAGTIVRLGIPVAALVALEATLFSVVGLMAGALGAVTLAAHQVLMIWVGVPFVIAIGVAEGGMVRVAHALGAKDARGARRAGLVALGVGCAILLPLVAAPVLMAEGFARLFIPASDPGFAEVSRLAARMMSIAAVFQVFDGAQAIVARCLRGLKDAYFPLWIGAFGYWGIGALGGWFLAFPLGWGGVGLWTGLAVGLIVTALLLTFRFLAVAGRLMRG